MFFQKCWHFQRSSERLSSSWSSTISLTPICAVTMTSRASWKIPFGGHSIMTPYLGFQPLLPKPPVLIETIKIIHILMLELFYNFISRCSQNSKRLGNTEKATYLIVIPIIRGVKWGPCMFLATRYVGFFTGSL